MPADRPLPVNAGGGEAAKEVVSADFEEPGDVDLVRKILGDMQDAGIEMSEHRLRHKMEECFATAKEQVMQD